MKWIKLILRYIKLAAVPLLFGTVFYILGNILPFKFFSIQVEDTPIKTNEYLTFCLGLVGTFVTSLAVLVALFKEDIRKIWENVAFKVNLSNPPILEKLNNEEVGTSDGTKTNYLKAVKYQTSIILENRGRLAARSCEIYIEKLLFESRTTIGPRSIEVPDVPFVWNDKGDTKILIPPKGKKSIPILEILSPKKQSLPNGKVVDDTPQLKFGIIENPADLRNGIWTGNFVVYSENVEPYRFSLSLSWNGEWAQRLSEMQNGITININ